MKRRHRHFHPRRMLWGPSTTGTSRWPQSFSWRCARKANFSGARKYLFKLFEDTGRDTSLLYGQQNEIKAAAILVAAGKDREGAILARDAILSLAFLDWPGKGNISRSYNFTCLSGPPRPLTAYLDVQESQTARLRISTLRSCPRMSLQLILSLPSLFTYDEVPIPIFGGPVITFISVLATWRCTATSFSGGWKWKISKVTEQKHGHHTKHVSLICNRWSIKRGEGTGS